MSNSGVKYLSESFSLNRGEASRLYSITAMCAAVFNLSSKKWSQLLISKINKVHPDTPRRQQILWSRKIFTCGAFGVMSVCFCLFCLVQHKLLAVSLFSLVSCMHTLFSAGYVSNYLDIAGSDAGVWNSIGNSIAQIPGFLGPIYLAFLLENFDGQWWPMFVTAAVMYAVASLVFGFFASTTMVTGGYKKKQSLYSL